MNDIPFVLVGNGLGFRMGRSLKFPKVPHNRLLLYLAHGFGHRIERLGNPDYCGGGPLDLASRTGPPPGGEAPPHARGRRAHV